MNSIIDYVNEFGALIGSFSEGLNYDAGAELFYCIASIGLNMVSGFGIVLAFSVPFLVFYWFIKFIEGVY